MGLDQPAKRSTYISVEGLDLRITVFPGDGVAFIAPARRPMRVVATIDRLDTIHARIEIPDANALPGLVEASDRVKRAVVEFYRQHCDFPADPAPGTNSSGGA